MFKTNLSVDDKIIKSRIQMFDKSPFFSQILLRMKMKEVPKEEGQLLQALGMNWQRTMGVDNKGNIYWDREWVSNLSMGELAGVFAHEVMHIALFHLQRNGTRDPRVFNSCNDMVVNNILINEGFELPEGIVPEKGKNEYYLKELEYSVKDIHEKSSEQIYDEIYPLLQKKQQEQGGSGSEDEKSEGSGAGNILKEKGFDEHGYSDKNKNEKGRSDSEAKKEIDDWKGIISNAATQAKTMGKMPAGIERLIEGLLDSKINWKSKLYRYIVSQIPFDQSWNLPSKRGVSQGIYLPRVLKESVEIVVSLDTSGSISQEELKEFLTEIVEIGTQFSNINMKIIICDAEVHETYDLTNDEIENILDLKISGGGGTSHTPILEHIKENLPDTKVAIHFTDGYSDMNSIEELGEGYDTLWVICSNGVAEKDISWGEVIKLESGK